MSFTPRPVDRSDDELGGATDMVPSPASERHQITPPVGLPVVEGAWAVDALDESTDVVPPLAPPAILGTPRPGRMARGSSTALPDQAKPYAKPRRATTPHTVARENLVQTIRGADLEDTRPNPVVDQRPACRRLGAYRITGVLASGQMGIVYRGEHPSHRRPFAIKAVHGQHERNSAVIARFFAESVVLARITHPNVVRFHDFGYDAEGSAYLVMELLEGETLTSRLARERRLPVHVAIDIALQIAHGLAATHALGIVHRDLKPDNVFLCSNGTVKLLDFGVAKLEGQGPTHTLQGDLLGTAAYMAPEQGRSASDSDARSDLYSVGCMLFEMVCGVVPFPGSLVETLVAHQTAQRPPARALNPHVSGELDALIDRLLARDPAARMQTALELVRALSALDGRSSRSLRRGPRSGTELIEDHTGARARSVTVSPVMLGILATLLGIAISFIAMR